MAIIKKFESQDERDRRNLIQAGMEFAVERMRDGDSPVILYKEHHECAHDYFAQGVVAAVLEDAMNARSTYRKKEEIKRNASKNQSNDMVGNL